MVPLPMSSNYITKYENPEILLGKSPGRDREIDDICQMIRNAAQGRNSGAQVQSEHSGRGSHGAHSRPRGRQYSTFVYDKARQDPPLTEAGPVSDDAYWERITYFLDRVIPVAEEYKVRMACHPHDPGMPRIKATAGYTRCWEAWTD